MRGLRYIWTFVLALLLPAASAAGKEFKVATPAEITSAMVTAQPGDTLTMQSGTWSDARIVFQGNGTADNPVLLRAEAYGSVVIAGASNLRIAGNYLVVSGLSFKSGYSPSGAVVEFRGSSSLESNYLQ
jgi:poly(beta-D-mannuronate) lyase